MSKNIHQSGSLQRVDAFIARLLIVSLSIGGFFVRFWRRDSR